MVALTGDRPRPEDFDHGSHALTALRQSVDQYVATHPNFYGEQPRFRSLQVGVSEARFHDYGHWNASGQRTELMNYQSPSRLFCMTFCLQFKGCETNCTSYSFARCGVGGCSKVGECSWKRGQTALETILTTFADPEPTVYIADIL